MNSRFRSSESVERAILDEKKFQYLYQDSNKYIFMDQQTYEQIELGSDLISDDQSKYLVENNEVVLQFYNEKAVGLELAGNIVLKVVETEGVVKGQTAASSYKPATLERGIKTSVPQFISVNDKIVISTIDSSYVEKAKKLMQPAVINIFEKAAKKAGKILTRDFGEIENLQIESKSVGDFVTNADVKVEQSILETLKYYYPNYTYITEESGKISGDENTIIIDPIDGTSNFIHGIPHVGIIIAKMTNNEITDGIIYNPILNEFFWSSKGKGFMV